MRERLGRRAVESRRLRRHSRHVVEFIEKSSREVQRHPKMIGVEGIGFADRYWYYLPGKVNHQEIPIGTWKMGRFERHKRDACAT